MMKLMDRLPAVISCCFCCFLRAGTVLIAVVTFMFGVIFAPNVTHSKGFWDMNAVLSNYSAATERVVQVIMGCASIGLCIVSVMLLIGALCNMPRLILIYQWGALLYSTMTTVLFFIMACICFFGQGNCVIAGVTLLALIVLMLLLTSYFVLVANSLRISLEFLSSTDLTSL